MRNLVGLHQPHARDSGSPRGARTAPCTLPEETVGEDHRTQWTALQNKLPDLPVHTKNGVQILAPAARFEDKRNLEHPEL